MFCIPQNFFLKSSFWVSATQDRIYLKNWSKHIYPKKEWSFFKGYATEGMFKLNVDYNKVNTSSYMIFFFNVWHSRLCHINKILVKTMSNLGMIHELF